MVKQRSYLSLTGRKLAGKAGDLGVLILRYDWCAGDNRRQDGVI